MYDVEISIMAHIATSPTSSNAAVDDPGTMAAADSASSPQRSRTAPTTRRNGVHRSQRERHHACRTCNDVFTRSEHLRRHEMSHQSQKPYRCSLCDLTSSRKDAILRHVKKFHRSTHAVPIFTQHAYRSTESHMESNSPSIPVTPPENCSQTPSAVEPTTPFWNDEVIAHPAARVGDSVLSSVAPVVSSEIALQPTSIDLLANPTTDFATLAIPSTSAQIIGFSPNLPHSWATSLAAESPPDFQILDNYIFQSLNSAPQHFIPYNTQRQKPLCSTSQLVGGFAGSGTGGHSSTNISDISDEDMQAAKANIAHFDSEDRLRHFKFPTKYQTIRFLKAFFYYFLPHTPILHSTSFSICTSPAPLILSVLSCGAIHMNETEIAMDLHQAVLRLLTEHDSLVLEGKVPSMFRLWEFQTRLLACQFGLFSGDEILLRQAKVGFSMLPNLVMDSKIELRYQASFNTWEAWILVETINRCAAWTGVLAAVLLSDEQDVALRFRMTEPDINLPCLEEMWSATEAEWHTFPKHETPLALSFQSIIDGNPLQGDISPFGLLVLISALQSHICSMEHLDTYQMSRRSQTEIIALETALHIWEEAWKSHPHCNLLPESLHGPLMADSILILNSAYYHLYASDQLRMLKAFARLPLQEISRTELRRLCELPCHYEITKALSRALQALILRARLGIRFLAKTASLSHACYGTLPAYEGCLLISWFLLRQRLRAHIEPKEFPDPALNHMMDKIVAECDYAGGAGEIPSRELLPLILNRDLLRERWMWKSASVLGENLDKLITGLQVLLD